MSYAGNATTALALLTKFGQTITITKRASGAYDPTQGSAAITTTTQTAMGAVFDMGLQSKVSSGSTGSGNVSQGDKQLLLPAKGLTKPDVNDTVTIGGEVWVIKSIRELNPAGTPILYDCSISK